MELRNRSDGDIYIVSTETDDGGFMILARSIDNKHPAFFMHYRTLNEFTEDWEDVY